MRITLKLSDRQHAQLVEAANARGKTARIPREDLFALLRDHSAALAALNQVNVETIADNGRKERQGA